MLSTIASYRILSADMDRSLKTTAASPAVARESAYYLKTIETIGSVDEFMANDRVYRFAMKAFGLSDMTYAKGFMRKALEGGVSDGDAFANKLSDSKYREFVKTFDFTDLGETATMMPRARQPVVDKYVRQTLEENAGKSNEGARLALYFQRKAASITSPYQILADTALLKVVQTALRIPAATGTMDIEKQAALITSRLDITDFKDSTKLNAFLSKFAALYDVDTKTATSSSPALALFVKPTESGIGQTLLQSLQGLKLGGN